MLLTREIENGEVTSEFQWSPCKMQVYDYREMSELCALVMWINPPFV